MDIFHNGQKTIPKGDDQIVRVDMETQQIGGRKSSLPSPQKNDAVISHVPTKG